MSAAKSPNLGIVIAGLLLGILMASMDSTIVATAMGNIVGELGGMDKFVWVTSAYLVAEMAGMPIFGKLSDMYGRKKFFIFGIIVFMVGSALCGTADTITQLAAYRAIQGIGGGALVPIAFAIMFDAVPLETRGSWAGPSVQYLDCRVYLVHCWVHILPIILLGSGYFILTCPLACWLLRWLYSFIKNPMSILNSLLTGWEQVRC